MTICFILISINIFYDIYLVNFKKSPPPPQFDCSYSYLEISGECNMMREVYRGRFQPEKGHQECVKRRAALSLSMSGACKVIKFNMITIIIYHYHRHYYCYIILNTSWCSSFSLVNSFTIWILSLSFTLWTLFCSHSIEIRFFVDHYQQSSCIVSSSVSLLPFSL